MKLTFLNGNPDQSSFDDDLANLKVTLEAYNHQATQLDLRELSFQRLFGLS